MKKPSALDAGCQIRRASPLPSAFCTNTPSSLSRPLRSKASHWSSGDQTGFAASAAHAAQGAALVADGLAGGSNADLVQTLGIADATGTALDHLYVITPEQAKRTLGIE